MNESELQQWFASLQDRLEPSYLSAEQPWQQSGFSGPAERWDACRRPIADCVTAPGAFLDIGCANGHLLATLPRWARERDVEIEPHGLELLPRLAERARRLHPSLADRIWTGAAMTWDPPRRFRYVTALEAFAPPDRLGELVARLLDRYVAPGGRLILSSYTDTEASPRPLADDLRALGYRPDGVIHIERPGRHPLQTIWLDRA